MYKYVVNSKIQMLIKYVVISKIQMLMFCDIPVLLRKKNSDAKCIDRSQMTKQRNNSRDINILCQPIRQLFKSDYHHLTRNTKTYNFHGFKTFMQNIYYFLSRPFPATNKN